MESIPPRLTRAESARINGAKSHGPTTDAGKQRSSANSLKFGFYTDQIILPGESPEEFFKLLDAYRIQFVPTNQLERDLIQDLADARWRIMRMKRMETLEWSQSTFDAAQDPILAEVPYEILNEYGHRQNYEKKGCPLEAIRRAEARYHRDFDRALKTLHQSRKLAASNQPTTQKVENEPKKAPEKRPDPPSSQPNSPPPAAKPDPTPQAQPRFVPIPASPPLHRL